jgi:CRP/FNR family transcriptional regulator
MVEIPKLKHIALFDHLPDAVLHEIVAASYDVDYEDGEMIVLEGQKNPPVFFILKGTVRIFHIKADGREQTLIYLQKGSSFNLPAVFSNDSSAPASATAAGGAHLLLIEQADFHRLAARQSDLALAVMCTLSNRLRHLSQLSYDLGLRSVRGRLARFLLLQAEGETAPIRWTHEEISARIGTVREVVSRTMRAFVREGLIEQDRHRIRVLDARALRNETES